MTKTATYALVRGKYFGKNGIRLKVGQTAELTKDQALAFKDMFEPAAVYKAKLKAVILEAEAAEAVDDADKDVVDDADKDTSDKDKDTSNLVQDKAENKAQNVTATPAKAPNK